ncbi:hypothetical protein CFC21_053756 [Triticum aestivum]|uniref:Secreted protein n=2 Tax=Triticum aestivum TaxID=4565 RepID=A0A9R1GC41_WHEAT|nr:hypothetical protein CFC21_053756 [Triticum aestivum]
MAQSHDLVLAFASLLHRLVTVLPLRRGGLAAPTTPSSASSSPLKVTVLFRWFSGGGGVPVWLCLPVVVCPPELLLPLFSDDAVVGLLILVRSRGRSGDVVVVVESSGGGADLQGCCGGLVLVLSTGAPAAGVHVAELLLGTSTTTWSPCLLRLGPLLQHRVPTGVPQKVMMNL